MHYLGVKFNMYNSMIRKLAHNVVPLQRYYSLSCWSALFLLLNTDLAAVYRVHSRTVCVNRTCVSLISSFSQEELS